MHQPIQVTLSMVLKSFANIHLVLHRPRRQVFQLWSQNYFVHGGPNPRFCISVTECCRSKECHRWVLHPLPSLCEGLYVCAKGQDREGLSLTQINVTLEKGAISIDIPILMLHQVHHQCTQQYSNPLHHEYTTLFAMFALLWLFYNNKNITPGLLVHRGSSLCTGNRKHIFTVVL